MTRAPGPPGLPRAPEPAAVELHLGWQYATPQAEPGPPPRRPVPPERQQLSSDWLAAQRREENLISRPLKIGCAAAVAALVVLAACVAAGWLPVLIAAPAMAACLVAVALTGFAIWQGERALRARIRAERLRVEQFRADQESRLFAWQAEHARQVREWQARRLAFESQKRWYAVALPAGIDRVDVAGGTLPGWSALLTMTAAHQLAVGRRGHRSRPFRRRPSRPTCSRWRAAAASSPPSGCCPLTCRGSTSPRRSMRPTSPTSSRCRSRWPTSGGRPPGSRSTPPSSSGSSACSARAAASGWPA